MGTEKHSLMRLGSFQGNQGIHILDASNGNPFCTILAPRVHSIALALAYKGPELFDYTGIIGVHSLRGNSTFVSVWTPHAQVTPVAPGAQSHGCLFHRTLMLSTSFSMIFQFAHGLPMPPCVLMCRAVSLQTGCTTSCSAPTPFSRRRVSLGTTQSCSTALTTPVWQFDGLPISHPGPLLTMLLGCTLPTLFRCGT